MDDTKLLVPGSPEWQERVKQIAEEEKASQLLCWWYLSFGDEEGWLGGVIVMEHGFTRAVLKTKVLGINPGGEVKGSPFAAASEVLPKGAVDRLLTREDLARLFGGAERWRGE